MTWERASLDALLYRIFDFEVRIPQALRAPYRGAVFILGMGLGLRGKILIVATLGAMVFLLGPWQGPLLLLLLALTAMAAGALAGVVYGALHPLARAGDFGVWLRWGLAIDVYLVTLAIFLPRGPFSVRDPAFHLIAWVFSALGALGLVLTDDRGASRLSPRQFKLMQNRVLLQAAPHRMWAALKRKRWKLEARRKALEEEATRRPTAVPALRTMLLDLETDLLQMRRGLTRSPREAGMQSDEVADLDAWIARVQRQLESLADTTP
jgi:hypothetical protein